MWILLIGMMFVTGVFCLVIALYQLTMPSPANQIVIPKPAVEDEDKGPKLTKLGRPIEERRMSA